MKKEKSIQADMGWLMRLVWWWETNVMGRREMKMSEYKDCLKESQGKL